MTDQASSLRDYVLQHGPARYDERHNITVEIAPKSVETFEEYQQRLAFWRVSQELRVKG
jgi:hypothetical protein